MALGYSRNEANRLARTAKGSYRKDLFFVIAKYVCGTTAKRYLKGDQI